MKTFISDLIPRIQRFSQGLDNLTLLTNQHWVVIDEITANKIVYIFRTNGDLLISQNGRVEKANWEYLGNNSLLIDKGSESYLFKHGFVDANVLALKIDGKNEYAFLVNENNYSGELNSIEKVIDFLMTRYVEPQLRDNIAKVTGIEMGEASMSLSSEVIKGSYETSLGLIEVELSNVNSYPEEGNRIYLNGRPAPTGKYKLGFMWYVHVENGIVTKPTLF